MTDRSSLDYQAQVLGCLLGGAVGDALGAPVEFARLPEIASRFGPQGVREYAEPDGRGRITDDTQMSLFTAEGLIRARVQAEATGTCDEASVIDHAYVRWLHTQGRDSTRWGDLEDDGWLIGRPELHVDRAPGPTCINGLRTEKAGTIEEPLNDRKGCGGVMRIAPVGLIPRTDAQGRFRLGAEAAALTHGHPSGYLAAGLLAAMIGAIVDGRDPSSALSEARSPLLAYPGHEEVAEAVDTAVDHADRIGLPSPQQIDDFGEGWVAEEALGIALWVSLSTDQFIDGISAAVTHSGDSDSTGAIAGNILGVALGPDAIPSHLVEGLVERSLVEEMAGDMASVLSPPTLTITDELLTRYPGT